MNILFTSAGRRGYLLDWFKRSGHFGTIGATNSEPCTAFASADLWSILPETTHESYPAAFFSLIEEWSIDVVIPLTDLDALAQSEMKNKLSESGVLAVCADYEMVKIMVDKLSWAGSLSAAGFPLPATFATVTEAREAIESGELLFPIFVKPRVGTSSQLARKVLNMGDFEAILKQLDAVPLAPIERYSGVEKETRFIFQEFIEGTEFGVDLLADLSGAYEGAFFREKIQSRGGETDRALTRRHVDFGFSLESFSKHLGMKGLTDIDLIVDTQGKAAVVDINPRIGGGYPFSHMAGADLPEYIHAWVEGRRANFHPVKLQERHFGKAVTMVEIPTSPSVDSVESRE